jgi:hypothetical protein
MEMKLVDDIGVGKVGLAEDDHADPVAAVELVGGDQFLMHRVTWRRGRATGDRKGGEKNQENP